MKWNKPQAVLNKLVLSVASISFILMLFWISFYFVWLKKPEMIFSLDEKIPDYYEQSINSHKKKLKEVNTKIKQSKLLQEFIEEFPDMTSLNKDYYLLADAYNMLIDNAKNADEYEKAVSIAKTWEERFPYDFRAKFKYFEIINHKDSQKANEYIEEVNRLFPDINEVNSLYVSSLIENQKFDKALNVASEFQQKHFNYTNIGFVIYYKDLKHTSYQAATKVIIPLENQTQSASNHTITLAKKIDQFKGLRFDIDGLQIGSIIQDVSFSIQTPENKFENIDFKPLHHIKSLEERFYQVSGSDPYFELIIPDKLMNSDSELKIQVNLSIEDKLNVALNEILENKEWRFFYSNNRKFNKEQSKSFNVHLETKEDINRLIGLSTIQPDIYSFLRVDLPWYIGMQPTKWKMMVNNEIVLTNSNILNSHSIETTTNQSIKVTGNDPYVIFQLPEAIEVKTLKIEMEFSHE
jgi:hypothetical protein